MDPKKLIYQNKYMYINIDHAPKVSTKILTQIMDPKNGYTKVSTKIYKYVNKNSKTISTYQQNKKKYSQNMAK